MLSFSRALTYKQNVRLLFICTQCWGMNKARAEVYGHLIKQNIGDNIMKKNKKLLLGFSLLVGLGSVQPASSSVTVFADIQTAGKSFDGISDPVVDVAGPFSVRFLADTGGFNLFGFGMVTSFDTSSVQASNASYGEKLTFSPSGEPPVINNTGGSIESLANVGFSAPPVSGSSVPLYSVDFNPTATFASFNLINSEYPTGNQFIDLKANPATVIFSPSQIRVVPVPAAIWLMLSGIAGWVGMRTHRS